MHSDDPKATTLPNFAERAWEAVGGIVIAWLFWAIIALMIFCTMAMGSMDLFIKAVTGAATAGVGFAVFGATRAFQRASLANEDKKLRLALFDKRLPVWNDFVRIWNSLNEKGDVSTQDKADLRRLKSEITVLFESQPLIAAFGDFYKKVNFLPPKKNVDGFEQTEFMQSLIVITLQGRTVADLMSQEMSLVGISRP